MDTTAIGFDLFYYSSEFCHGIATTVSGASSYKFVYSYRASSNDAWSTKARITNYVDGNYFRISLTAGYQYQFWVQGEDSSGNLTNWSDAKSKTFTASNDRSAWTVHNGSTTNTTYQNIAAGGTKRSTFLMDDYYYYRFPVSFQQSGVASITAYNLTTNTLIYLSETTSNSNGKPETYLLKDNGTSDFTLGPTVSANKTYYLFVRANDGGGKIGRFSIKITAPEAPKVNPATKFESFYYSSTTAHGYVGEIDGAESYYVYYNKKGSAAQQSATMDGRYFIATGLTANETYEFNYYGLIGNDGGEPLTSPKTIVAKNDRAWTVYNGTTMWQNLGSGVSKSSSFLTDDYYLYKFPVSFSSSGTAKIRIEHTNFSVLVYISTTENLDSEGKNPAEPLASNSGNSAFEYTINVSRNTQYYVWVRPTSNGYNIGKYGLKITAPKSSIPSASGKNISATATTSSITVTFESLSGDVDSYRVYWKPNGDTNWYYTIVAADKNSVTLTDSKIKANTIYYLYYVAVLGNTEGTKSSTINITTPKESTGLSVYIGNGSSWVKYTPYIGNGSSWVPNK